MTTVNFRVFWLATLFDDEGAGRQLRDRAVLGPAKPFVSKPGIGP